MIPGSKREAYEPFDSQFADEDSNDQSDSLDQIGLVIPEDMLVEDPYTDVIENIDDTDVLNSNNAESEVGFGQFENNDSNLEDILLYNEVQQLADLLQDRRR